MVLLPITLPSKPGCHIPEKLNPTEWSSSHWPCPTDFTSCRLSRLICSECSFFPNCQQSQTRRYQTECFAVLHRKPTPASRKDFWNSGYQTTLVCPNSLHPSLTDNSILFGLLVFLYRNTSHLHTRNTAKQFSTASGYCFFHSLLCGPSSPSHLLVHFWVKSH